MIRFFETDNPTQVVLIFAGFTLAWLSIWNRRPADTTLRSLHLERVTILLSLSLINVVGAASYWLVTSVWPYLIISAASIFWGLACVMILAMYPVSLAWRILAVAIFLIIFLLFQSITDNHEWSGIPAKPSIVIRGTYASFSTFLVLCYYGLAYRVWHERRPSSRTLDSNAVTYLVVILAASLAGTIGMFFAGVDVLGVSVTSSVVLLAVTVVLRDKLQNAFSGISLLIDNSVNQGDVITINGTQEGRVVGTTLHHTIIADWNGIRTLIPNSTLASSTIKNWSHAMRQSGTGSVRVDVKIGVAFSTDRMNASIRFVRAARKVKRALQKPLPQVQISGLEDSAITFQVGVWINDPQNGINNVRSQIYFELLEECDQTPQIVIPFPQREVRVIGSLQSSPGCLAAAA